MTTTQPAVPLPPPVAPRPRVTDHVTRAGWILLALFILLYGPLWTWIGYPKPAAGKVTELRILTWAGGSLNGPNEEEILFRLLEEQNPDIRIKNVHTPFDSFTPKLLTMAVGDVLPDLIWVVGAQLPYFATRGLLYDLTEVTAHDPELDTSRYFPQGLRLCMYQDRLYGLPRDICCWFIAYNKNLFRREGVPFPKPDWTEEDFVRIGSRFVKDLDHDGRPDQFGIDWYPRDDAAVGEGGWFYDPGAWRATCAEPAYVRAMTFMRDIIWKTQILPNASRGQLSGFGNPFMAGRVAMEAAGPWSFHNLRAECTFDWDIVPTPRGSLGRVNTLLGQPIAISARTRHFAEAYRALKFLCYSEIAQKRQAKEGIALPSRWDLAASYYRTLKTNPPSIDLFLDALGHAKAVPVGPADSEVVATLDPGYELLQLNLAQPQEEMDRVGKRIQRILDRRARVERRALQ